MFNAALYIVVVSKYLFNVNHLCQKEPSWTQWNCFLIQLMIDMAIKQSI